MIKTLRRQQSWFLGTTLAVLAVTLVACLAVPRRYTATGGVWLDHRLDALVPAEKRDASELNQTVRRNTELRYLKSPDVAGRAVDALGLAKLPGFGQPGGGGAVPPAAARARAVAKVVNGLKVRANGASYAVLVRYTARDAKLAASIVNQLLDRYVDYRRNGGERGRASAQLRTQLETAKAGLKRLAARADAYDAANKPLAEAELSQLRLQVADDDAQIALASSDGGPNSIAGGAPGQLRDLRAQRAQLSAARAEAMQKGGDNGAEVAALDERLANADRAISFETRRLGRVVATIRADRARVEATIDRNTRILGEQARLRHAADAARASYASLATLDQEAAAARFGRAGAYVMTRAAAPAVADFPGPWSVLLLGTLIALVAGTTAALARERLAPGLRTRQGAERRLGVPVVGMVPDTTELNGDGRQGVSPVDLILTDTRSSFAASFKSIHTGLRLGAGRDSPRSVAVTSAVAEEGKTTAAICLARSAALAGLRVVLVDCDVRRPAASQALAPGAEAGLGDVLAGKAELKRALVRDAPSGAWVLPNSDDGDMLTGALDSSAMEALVAQLARDFDLVVLDTAPVLALAETRVVAGFADTVLLVARWRETPVGATRIALDTISQAGAKVAGLALTRVGL